MRAIPDPGYADDDGSAAPSVVAALREVAAGGSLEVALAALSDARVLVPVVATPGEAAPGEPSARHGRRSDADAAMPAETPDLREDREGGADMSAVLLTGRDGRRGLLAFTDLSTLRAWDADARPVPVGTRQAAQAALAEGAEALVVDVAGPVQVPIEGDALRRIADGQRLVRDGTGWAWASPLH